VTNYIQDTNPFRLAGPPKWWLRRLWDFDSSLVVVPSRQGFYYRLAQRRQLNLSEKMALELMSTESDAKMMASYGLIPVTTILSTANWDSPLMWIDLAERAPWRQGGAEKVINHIEGLEAQKEAKIDALNDEMITERAQDSWKIYRKKIGLGRTWYSGADLHA
jgi:hypothetical protein